MRFLLLICFFLPVTTSWADSQVSVGFSEPAATGNLLDYRLPDWGYRLWSAAFSLGGGGYDARLSGETSIQNNFGTSLASRFTLYGESEAWEREFTGGMSGHFNRDHSGIQDSERSGHSLEGEYDFSISAKRYLGDSPLAIMGSIADDRRYRETSTDFRNGDQWTKVDKYYRRNQHQLEVGLTLGRLRDVVPLLRAERLNQRLAALDVGRLSSDQVRHVAEVIATRYGYGRVYDRVDRHFWSDVLEPLLGVTLSPYQIYFLAEVLDEDLGQRRQGMSLEAAWEYQGYSSFNSDSSQDNDSRTRNGVLALNWSRNLSLDRQLTSVLAWQYGIRNAQAYKSEFVRLLLSLQHLWNVADRHLWITQLGINYGNDIQVDARDREGTLDSTWEIRIEDQLTLRLNARLRYSWRKWHQLNPTDFGIHQGWNWGYGVTFVYQLDRGLL